MHLFDLKIRKNESKIKSGIVYYQKLVASIVLIIENANCKQVSIYPLDIFIPDETEVQLHPQVMRLRSRFHYGCLPQLL